MSAPHSLSSAVANGSSSSYTPTHRSGGHNSSKLFHNVERNLIDDNTPGALLPEARHALHTHACTQSANTCRNSSRRVPHGRDLSFIQSDILLWPLLSTHLYTIYMNSFLQKYAHLLIWRHTNRTYMDWSAPMELSHKDPLRQKTDGAVTAQ